MSFSGGIKDEIARHISKETHCQKAEIAAIVRFAGTVCAEKGKEAILVETENVGLAKKYLQLIKTAFDIQAALQIRKRAQKKNNQYVIFIEGQKAAEAVKQIVFVSEDALRQTFAQTCCRRAFIRGAFLAAGSMSNPGKSYHLEIVCRSEENADMLRRVIETFQIHPKTVVRKSRQVLYLKDSTEIVDLLNVMGAHRSLMELENIRILKDMRNSANRQYNCDSANINKMVQAAARQVEDIRYIERNLGLEQLNSQLREIAEARLEYPDVSLLELGTYLNPPVGKSGVNHRLRKLAEIAQDLRMRQEK